MAGLKDKFRLWLVRDNIAQVKRELPIRLANVSQNYFVGSFTKQGFDGQQWQEVKRRIPGTPEYEYPRKKDLGRRTRPILIGKGSGKLRRAVSNSIRVQVWPQVRLVVDLAYAAAHNEGNPARNLPKRQFIGQTPELTLQQEAIMKRYFDSIWK